MREGKLHRLIARVVLLTAMTLSISGCFEQMRKRLMPEPPPAVKVERQRIQCDRSLMGPLPIIDTTIFDIGSADKWRSVATYYESRNTLCESVLYGLQDCVLNFNLPAEEAPK